MVGFARNLRRAPLHVHLHLVPVPLCALAHLVPMFAHSLESRCRPTLIFGFVVVLSGQRSLFSVVLGWRNSSSAQDGGKSPDCAPSSLVGAVSIADARAPIIKHQQKTLSTGGVAVRCARKTSMSNG